MANKAKTIKHLDLRRGVGNAALLGTRPSPYQTDANSFLNTTNKPLPVYRFTIDDSVTTRYGFQFLTEASLHLVTEAGFNILTE